MDYFWKDNLPTVLYHIDNYFSGMPTMGLRKIQSKFDDLDEDDLKHLETIIQEKYGETNGQADRINLAYFQ